MSLRPRKGFISVGGEKNTVSLYESVCKVKVGKIMVYLGRGRGETVDGLIRAEGVEVDPKKTGWGCIIKEETCMSCKGILCTHVINE